MDAEDVELGVCADDRDIERESLGGDDPVEWVTVVSDEATSPECGFCVDWYKRVTCLFYGNHEPALEGFGIGELAEADFGCNLPRRGCRYKNCIVRIGDDAGCDLA